MATGDLDVIKEVPGYKVILKAVVRSQIQQLIDHLAAYTEEESIILTASVADGTLSHIGSESGKSFLSDNEEVKSQFLGFCLKYHHLKMQKEKERERQLAEEKLQKEQQERLQQMMAAQYQSPPLMPTPSQRYASPRQPGYGPGQTRFPGPRHEPYPVSRPSRKPRAVSQNQGQKVIPSGDESAGDIVKTEPDDSEDASVQSASGNNSVPCSPARKGGKSEKDDVDNQGDNDAGAESEGADVSNITGDDQASNSELDSSVAMKLEELTDADMDLEITGVEPGRGSEQQGWDPSVSMGMNFDLSGATGSPSDALNKQAYKYRHTDNGPRVQQNLTETVLDRQCKVCRQIFSTTSNLKMHISVHTGDKPFKCSVCRKSFRLKHHLNGHMVRHMNFDV